MSKRIFLLILSLILFLSPVLSFADNSDKQKVSLNFLIDEALKNNPQIQAAKFRYEAAKSRVKLLRTLEDPKLEFEYDTITADMDAVMRGKTSPMRTFSISQEFPFPTKLFLRRAAAQKESASYEQEYKETVHKVIKDVKEGFFQLFLNNKKTQITNENLDLLNQFIDIANKKYSLSKVGQQDSLRAQVEYSKLSNQLVLLQQEEMISRAILISLLNRSSDTEIGILEEGSNKTLALDEEATIKLAKDSRSELQSFKEMVRKSEIDLSLAKQEYLPNFMIKYKHEERNGSAGSWAGMLGVTIPFWFWEKQDSFVKEAKANVEVVKADYRATENLVLFEVRSSYAKFEAAKKLVSIYETGVLPQAQAALETARIGYQAGKINFLDLLDSQRALKEFQIEYFESLANLEIDLANLERSVGTELK